MNKLLLFFVAAISLTACSSSDKNTEEKVLTQSQQTDCNGAYVKKYDFTSADITNHVSLTGFAGVEVGNGTWTCENEAIIDMPWETGSTATISMNVTPFVTKSHKIDVEVYIEDVLYEIWKFDSDFSETKNMFVKPSNVTDDVISLKFSIKTPKSPAELGLNSDVRKLGLFFEKITVYGFKE